MVTPLAGIDDAAVVPDIPTESAGTSSSPSGALSYLAGSWVNTRLINVANKANDILGMIIGQGLLADGFTAFESPITDDMLMRMSPEQLETFIQTIPDLQGKADILNRLAGLKLPHRVELPPEYATPSPAPKSKLAFGPEDVYTYGRNEQIP